MRMLVLCFCATVITGCRTNYWIRLEPIQLQDQPESEVRWVNGSTRRASNALLVPFHLLMMPIVPLPAKQEFNAITEESLRDFEDRYGDLKLQEHSRFPTYHTKKHIRPYLLTTNIAPNVLRIQKTELRLRELYRRVADAKDGEIEKGVFVITAFNPLTIIWLENKSRENLATPFSVGITQDDVWLPIATWRHKWEDGLGSGHSILPGCRSYDTGGSDWCVHGLYLPKDDYINYDHVRIVFDN